MPRGEQQHTLFCPPPGALVEPKGMSVHPLVGMSVPPSVCPSCYLLLHLWTKTNQILCVSCSHKWDVQHHNFPHPLRPWGGANKSSHKLMIYNISDRIFIRSPGSCPRGGTWRYWGWGSKMYFFRNSTKNSEYDQEIPQSQTADNPVARRGRAAQPSLVCESLT